MTTCLLGDGASREIRKCFTAILTFSLCCSLWGFALLSPIRMLMSTTLHCTGYCTLCRPAYEGSNEILKPWAGIIQAGCNTWRNWHDIDVSIIYFIQ